MAATSLNRRQFARYRLEPMYSPIAIRLPDQDQFCIDGHAYDISEGGCRFEADRAMLPGTLFAMQIQIPANSDEGPGRAIFVMAECVWIEDEEDPAPVRMAARFTGFPRAGDRERLLRQFSTGRYRLVA
ncbi:MAG: PilZ domain-containing protein [Phycisphaerales bacterium]|nr:PilZ domain-containing protein [Phycisphaerales bacterium]